MPRMLRMRGLYIQHDAQGDITLSMDDCMCILRSLNMILTVSQDVTVAAEVAMVTEVIQRRLLTLTEEKT